MKEDAVLKPGWVPTQWTADRTTSAVVVSEPATCPSTKPAARRELPAYSGDERMRDLAASRLSRSLPPRREKSLDARIDIVDGDFARSRQWEPATETPADAAARLISDALPGK